MVRPSKVPAEAGSASERDQNRHTSACRKQKRPTTLYDAVAGCVSPDGFILSSARASKYRDTISKGIVSVPPEEALFRRQGAPERYEEDDIYWADRFLTEEQTLPESDLLKAIHAYASDFYGRATSDGGQVDFESMDETALLGLGMLLEEMAEHVLGETGDLAFVEGEEVGGEDGSRNVHDDAKVKDRAMLEHPETAPESSDSAHVGHAKSHRKSKRRKIEHRKDRSKEY